MKILHVCSGKGLGGTRTVFLSHQRLFEEIGIDSTPIIRLEAKVKDKLSKVSLKKLKEINYIRRIPIKWKKDFKVMRNLTDNSDIIWVHKPIDAYIWRKVSSTAKIIMVVHGFQNTNLNRADYLVAVSQPVLEHLNKKGLNNIFLINNFLSAAISKHRITWNKKINISAFGFFRRKKGFTDFIRALNVLQKTVDPNKYTVNIYGNGRLAIILKTLKVFLKIKNLKINNWTNDMENCLRNTDIVVIPSRSESFSMIAIEGMAQGCLIVSTKCKGPEFIITNNVDGILIEKRNPTIMAEKLKEIIESPELFVKIRQTGREMVSQTFSIENSKKSVQEILSLICS
ncbi:MAG: glycosyltransferase family 4 protein [Holosporales bacterium]|nr:glycosyltransferase family 4 protein [Holosporales bacterium]